MTKLKLYSFLSVFILTQVVRAEITTDTIKPKQIKEITVLAKIPTNLSFPMVIVNANSLQNSSFFTPADVLQQETGISIARDGVWSTSINVRGFSEQRVLEMVDGDRIQTATEHSGPMSTIDMNSLESIEVIKGAASVLYGTGAMGGVVNFITKTPGYTDTSNTKGNVGTEFNTVNSLWANFANVQFTTKQWYLGLNGSFRTAQNTMTPGGPLLNSQFHDASWGVKAGIKYSENQEFKANYQHFEGWDIGIPGGRTFPETATARYIGIARNQLVGEYIISDISYYLTQINIKAYSQNISRDVELKPANSSLTLFPGSLNKTSGVKITTNWEFENYQKLILGAEGWVRDAKTIRLTENNSAEDVLVVTADLPTPNAQMYDAGIFAHYSWEFIPDKWAFNAGLRLDYIQITNDSAFYPLYQFTVENNIKTYADNLSRSLKYPASINENINYAAHIDLVYNVTKAQQLTLSLSNSYRSPSIEELFKNIDLGGNIHIGNSNLKPEQGTFSNLNYTILGSNFSIKTDVFANYLTNLIQEVQTTATSNIYENQNISNAMFLGAEMEGKWLVNRQLDLLVNASYTNARDVDSKTYLPQIPPLHGYAALNFKNKNFGATVSSLWAATQTEIASTETSTPGSIIFNFDIRSAQINLSKTFLQIYAGVNNILDTSYFNHLSSTRGVVKLEPGRNVYAKIKWGW
ncbi:MAG: TonB-dependent receptor [Paludibacter sp.]|nr:TonB-dependent receptor [Paludibacter sp.]